MVSDASERRKRKDSGIEHLTKGSDKNKRRNGGSGQSAWDRHMLYVERYIAHYDSSARSREEKIRRLRAADRNDWDVLKDTHRFLREDEEPTRAKTASASYEYEVAKKYYDSLFKDYVIADLKHYKSGDVAMRWRSEDDVIGGIGQFTCANARCGYHGTVDRHANLKAFEVNFAYEEVGTVEEQSSEKAKKKNALVKIVLCRRCAKKLSYAREVGDESQSMSKPLHYDCEPTEPRLD